MPRAEINNEPYCVFRETANPSVYFPCVHSWNNNPPWFADARLPLFSSSSPSSSPPSPLLVDAIYVAVAVALASILAYLSETSEQPEWSSNLHKGEFMPFAVPRLVLDELFKEKEKWIVNHNFRVTV